MSGTNRERKINPEDAQTIQGVLNSIARLPGVSLAATEQSGKKLAPIVKEASGPKLPTPDLKLPVAEIDLTLTHLFEEARRPRTARWGVDSQIDALIEQRKLSAQREAQESATLAYRRLLGGKIVRALPFAAYAVATIFSLNQAAQAGADYSRDLAKLKQNPDYVMSENLTYWTAQLNIASYDLSYVTSDVGAPVHDPDPTKAKALLREVSYLNNEFPEDRKALEDIQIALPNDWQRSLNNERVTNGGEFTGFRDAIANIKAKFTAEALMRKQKVPQELIDAPKADQARYIAWGLGALGLAAAGFVHGFFWAVSGDTSRKKQPS